MTFKIGDRVRVCPTTSKGLFSDRTLKQMDGWEGTVIEIDGAINGEDPNIGVRFDERKLWMHSCGHSTDPFYLNHCWWCRPKDLELVDDAATGYTLDDWEDLLAVEQEDDYDRHT